MIYENIVLDKKDGWAKITLNRPAALNAINLQVQLELGAALDEIERDEQLRVLIIAGSGSCFSAGADLREIMDALGNIERFHRITASFVELTNRIESLSKPVIAMVHGFALAGGLELALACDIIIAADDARIGDQHANFGLVPGGGNTQRIPRIMGTKRGLEHILTGEWLSGKEAERLGLVSKAVPSGKLEETTMEMVGKLLTKSPVASRTIKRLVYQGAQTDLRTGLQLEVFGCSQHMLSEDLKEGVSAFVEKRKPKFKGR